jgi:hypothetical protein
VPGYCHQVGRVLVTPTRVVLLPPETELSNRVLRHYKQHSDRFLRVSFVEEDSGRLHLSNKEGTRDLADRLSHSSCSRDIIPFKYADAKLSTRLRLIIFCSMQSYRITRPQIFLVAFPISDSQHPQSKSCSAILYLAPKYGSSN